MKCRRCGKPQRASANSQRKLLISHSLGPTSEELKTPKSVVARYFKEHSFQHLWDSYFLHLGDDFKQHAVLLLDLFYPLLQSLYKDKRSGYEETIRQIKKKYIVQTYQKIRKFYDPSFFLLLLHGEFGSLEEGEHLGSLFLKIPAKTRLFFATKGEGTLCRGNNGSLMQLHKDLAIKKIRLFQDPELSPEGQVKEFSKHAKLFEAGNLFPNFTLSFANDPSCDVFTCFKLPDAWEKKIQEQNGSSHEWTHFQDLFGNGWNLPAGKLNEDSGLTYDLRWTLDVIRNVVGEDQEIDILLFCCNPSFENSNETTKKKFSKVYRKILKKGSANIEAWRAKTNGPTTRSRHTARLQTSSTQIPGRTDGVDKTLNSNFENNHIFVNETEVEGGIRGTDPAQ